MNDGAATAASLVGAMIALLPACVVFASAAILFSRERTLSSWLQIIGAAFLALVVLCHIFEALHWFSWMGWGRTHSAGHYLDLSSAILGLTLFPAGYLMHALEAFHPRP